MVAKVATATVRLWGKDVGAVSCLQDRGYAVFEYYPSFLKDGRHLPHPYGPRDGEDGGWERSYESLLVPPP